MRQRMGKWGPGRRGLRRRGRQEQMGEQQGYLGLGGAPVHVLPPHPLSTYSFLRQHLLDGPGL